MGACAHTPIACTAPAWFLTDRRLKASQLAAGQKVQIVTAHGPPVRVNIAARGQGNTNAYSLPGRCSGN